MFAPKFLLSLTAASIPACVVASEGHNGQHVLHDSVQHNLPTEFDKVRNELKEADIIPTVIDDFLPSFLIEAEWSSKNYASLGNTLKPTKLQDAPAITLRSGPGACAANTTYTVALTDPDAPSRDDPEWSEVCHWIATGVTVSGAGACALSLAGDVVPYKAPGPPEKTGKHRYVFVVFAPVDGTAGPLDLTEPADRKHWGYDYEGERVGVRRWSQENGLVPIAANFIYAQNKKQ